jgi:hypothetical protein
MESIRVDDESYIYEIIESMADDCGDDDAMSEKQRAEKELKDLGALYDFAVDNYAEINRRCQYVLKKYIPDGCYIEYIEPLGDATVVRVNDDDIADHNKTDILNNTIPF